MKSNRRVWLNAFAVVLTSLSAVNPAVRVQAEGRNPDYMRDVRPILAHHCFRCHGADEQSREAGLRLDSRESAVHGGDSSQAAIVPGNPDMSLLIQRVTASDESEQMPPPEAKSPLTAAQVQTLRKWIEGGAHYQTHWAMVAPER